MAKTNSWFNQKAWRYRSRQASRQLTNEKLPKEPRRSKHIKEDKNREKVVPPQARIPPMSPRPPRPTLLRVKKPGKRNVRMAIIREISLRSCNITAEKRAIMLNTVPN